MSYEASTFKYCGVIKVMKLRVITRAPISFYVPQTERGRKEDNNLEGLCHLFRFRIWNEIPLKTSPCQLPRAC